MDPWPAVDVLDERLLAIDTVSRSYGIDVVEHLLVGLVQCLEGGGVERDEAVVRLVDEVLQERPQWYACEYVVAVLGWPELIAALEAVVVSDSRHNNRRLAGWALGKDEFGEALPDYRGTWRTLRGADDPGAEWPAEVELAERLQAIESIFHAVGNSDRGLSKRLHVSKHLLLDLVGFLSSGRLSRDLAVASIMAFVRAEPRRLGSADVIEVVGHYLRWSQLVDGVEQLASDAGVSESLRSAASWYLKATQSDWLGAKDFEPHRKAIFGGPDFAEG